MFPILFSAIVFPEFFGDWFLHDPFFPSKGTGIATFFRIGVKF